MFRFLITLIFLLTSLPAAFAGLSVDSASNQVIDDQVPPVVSADAIVIAGKRPPPKLRKPVTLKKAAPKAKTKPTQARKKPRVSKGKPRKVAKAKRPVSVSAAARLANIKKVSVSKKKGSDFTYKVRSSTASSNPRKASLKGRAFYNDGTKSLIPHIRKQHGADSQIPKKGKFAPGTSDLRIRALVKLALKKGVISTDSKGLTTISYQFKKHTIGKNLLGQPTKRITVYIRDGIVQTAFPD